LLGRAYLDGPCGNEKIRLETYQFRREGQSAVLSPLRIAALDDQVLAVGIPELTQSLQPRLPIRITLEWAMVGIGLITAGRG